MASNETAFREIAPIGTAGHTDFDGHLQWLREQIRRLNPDAVRQWLSSWQKRSVLLRPLLLAGVLLLASAGLFAALAVISVLPAVLFGLAVGFWASWEGMRRNLNCLLQPPKLSQVVSCYFDGKTITCSFNANLERELDGGPSRRLLVAAIGGLASALAIFDTIISKGTFFGLSVVHGWLQTAVMAIACFLPLVIGFVLCRDRHIQQRMAGQFKRRILALANSASVEVCRTREIDGVLAGIDVLCKALNIVPPAEHRSAILKFVQQNCASVVLDPKCAEPFVETITELARQDLANLGNALAFHEQLQNVLLVVGGRVQDSRNPLLENQLETIEPKTSEIAKLLSQRRWNSFQQRCGELTEELNRLQQRARARKEPPAVLAPGVDPYRLLGVDRETPTPHIKRLRTRLAQIYHPDASEAFPNASKMAEVNAAFDAVITDRHEKP